MCFYMRMVSAGLSSEPVRVLDKLRLMSVKFSIYFKIAGFQHRFSKKFEHKIANIFLPISFNICYGSAVAQWWSI